MAEIDIAVVGAGFSGLYLLHRLRSDGFRVQVIEAGGDLGGTWYWNRYPGLRCDIESLQYCYSFSDDLQREWHWSERYASQAEILRYLNHVAERFDLRRDIAFNTRATAANWDETAGRWRVVTERGAPVVARVLIMASGPLSQPNLPDIKGIGDFAGPIYHTGKWPHEPVDFTGRNVAVIGTGSSGIQAIPLIARQARQLTVFQRTANFVVPAWNRPMDRAEQDAYQAHHANNREQLRWSPGGYRIDLHDEPLMSLPRDVVLAELERRWQLGGLPFTHIYPDTKTDRAANEVVAEFLRGKIRRRVKDPQTAERLVPHGYPFGTKRLCVDTDYFETFNRPNVSLVDLTQTPILQIAARSLRTRERSIDAETIVLATGFDAVTGALLAVDLRGRGGVALRDVWSAGPKSYLGLMVAGFPNLFTITGPTSPSILSNVAVSIEQHVEWIADCLGHMRARTLDCIEPEPAAEADWVARCHALAAATFFPEAASWYMGANIPGKPRVMLPFTGGVGVYRGICNDIAAKGYDGFRLSAGACPGGGA